MADDQQYLRTKKNYYISLLQDSIEWEQARKEFKINSTMIAKILGLSKYGTVKELLIKSFTESRKKVDGHSTELTTTISSTVASNEASPTKKEAERNLKIQIPRLTMTFLHSIKTMKKVIIMFFKRKQWSGEKHMKVME